MMVARFISLYFSFASRQGTRRPFQYSSSHNLSIVLPGILFYSSPALFLYSPLSSSSQQKNRRKQRKKGRHFVLPNNYDEDSSRGPLLMLLSGCFLSIFILSLSLSGRHTTWRHQVDVFRLFRTNRKETSHGSVSPAGSRSVWRRPSLDTSIERDKNNTKKSKI